MGFNILLEWSSIHSMKYFPYFDYWVSATATQEDVTQMIFYVIFPHLMVNHFFIQWLYQIRWLHTTHHRWHKIWWCHRIQWHTSWWCHWIQWIRLIQQIQFCQQLKLVRNLIWYLVAHSPSFCSMWTVP